MVDPLEEAHVRHLQSALALIVASLICASPACRAMAEVPDRRRSAFARREAQPDGADAPDPGRQTGFLGHRGSPLTACHARRRRETFQECGSELPMSRYGINMGIGMPGGLPYQPWAAQQVKTQTEQNSKDDPHARCLPDTFVRALRPAAHAEVRPGARPSRDARRVERRLPAGLHRRTAAAGRSRNRRGRATRRANGWATRSSSTRSDSAMACGSTSSGAR